MAEIVAALDALPYAADMPSLMIAHTVKGKGVSFAEDTHLWHQNMIDDEIYEYTRFPNWECLRKVWKIRCLMTD